MIGQFTIGGRVVRVDFTQGTCLAIPMNFGGPQPSHFGAAPARAEPMTAGNFIGDTRLGGSCNVPIVTINPHCNGTHTETIAHITDETVPIHEVLSACPIPTTLVTVAPLPAHKCGERYHPSWKEGDQLITAASLNTALTSGASGWLEALVIRTLPNGIDKLTRRYGEGDFPPFLSLEAIDLISGLGIDHLLVDLPSVDKMHDEGLLTVHHRFWNVPDGTHQLMPDSRIERTITEMIYVLDELPDGRYLLDLQIPAFTTDAAPSRPWLYPVEFI